MIDLLIAGGTVITMDPQHRVLEGGAVAVDDGCIVAVTQNPEQIQAQKTMTPQAVWSARA